MDAKVHELPIRSITFHNKLKFSKKKPKLKKKDLKDGCNKNIAMSFSDEELDYGDKIKPGSYGSNKKELDNFKTFPSNDKNMRNKLNSFEEIKVGSNSMENIKDIETEKILSSSDILDENDALSERVKHFCDDVKANLEKSISLTSLSKLVNPSDLEDDAKSSSFYDFDNHSIFGNFEDTYKIKESEKEDILENWRKRRRLEKFKKEGENEKLIEKITKMGFKKLNAMEEHLVDENLEEFYQKFKSQSLETECDSSIKKPSLAQQPCQNLNTMGSFNYSKGQSNVCQAESSVNHAFNHQQLPTIPEWPINFHHSHQSLYQNNLLQQQSFLISLIKSLIEISNKKEHLQNNIKSSTVSTQTTPQLANFNSNKIFNQNWIQNQKAKLSKKRENKKLNKRKNDLYRTCDSNLSTCDTFIDSKEELNDLLEISDSEEYKDDDVLILMRQKRYEILKNIKMLL